MSLQRIINACETLNIDRRRVTGVQFTRSEIAKANETVTRNPWRFNLAISAALKYDENRDLLEQIDYLDRTIPEVVSFSTTTGASKGLAYMFAYQGSMSSAQLSAITVNGFSGNQLVLQGLPTVNQNFPSTTIMFKKGDFIQVAGYPYPFTVVGPAANNGVITPGDVQRGNGSTLQLTVHRPNFISANLSGLGINVGNAVQFRVFCPNMPTYKLSPGGTNAIISWSSDFQLYEYTGDVA